jgi:hypothetical protein
MARAALGGLRRVLADGDDAGHEVVAVERHRQHLVDPLRRVRRERVLGHGQDDHWQPEVRVVDLTDQLHPPDAALEQAVDDDDVGALLDDVVQRGAAVGDDVDEADLRLGVQQAADVLRDLGDVLDQEEPDLIASWHGETR